MAAQLPAQAPMQASDTAGHEWVVGDSTDTTRSRRSARRIIRPAGINRSLAAPQDPVAVRAGERNQVRSVRRLCPCRSTV